MTSLSVLIPTFNSMPLLPAHLESMKPWLDLATEIVVVDSFSTDGTPGFLREELSAYPATIHNHPRGLYQSWNYGIQRAEGRWLYISTVGDSISREQLLHHLEIAENFDAQVVLSSPRWIDENDAPALAVRWAVNDIIDLLSLTAPRVLDGTAANFFAVLHTYSSALLGSAASDLFRTNHLQKHPFPVEYGMSGDGAWGLRHALNTRFVITPRQGSTFRLHTKPYSLSDYHVEELGERLYQLARSALADSPPPPGPFHGENIDTLELARTASRLYADLKTLRQKRRPWFLFPDAWFARLASKRAVTKLKNQKASVSAAIRRAYDDDRRS